MCAPPVSSRLFAPEGRILIGLSAGICLLLVAVALRLSGAAAWVTGILGVAVLLFTLYFFRDPERTAPPGADNMVLAPADGMVVVIQESDEPEYIGGPVKQVSIFLSPLNVHVNRVPVSGVVEYVKYYPGEYLVAWHEKASEKNERSVLGVRHSSGARIVFKQIAGFIARRIVYHLNIGDNVVAGERFGLVKFGSRMDVLLPPGMEPTVSVGDRVTAGETIIARFDGQD